MGAGGQTDFGGLAQAGMGEGFAKGVESGLEQYNIGVDRKQKQASAYMQNMVIPALQNANRIIAPPKPEDGPEAHAQYLEAVAAQATTRAQIQERLPGILKDTGSPFSAEDIMNMYSNPENFVDPVKISQKQQTLGKYMSLAGQEAEFMKRLNSIDPVKNPEQYKVVFEGYNQWLNESGYAELYRQQRDADYVPAATIEEAQAKVNDTLTQADRQVALSFRGDTRNPEAAAVADTFFKNGASITDKVPGMDITYKQYFTSQSDAGTLQRLIMEGTQDSLSQALHRLQLYNDEQIATMPPEIQAFKQWITDPSKLEDGPLKSLFNKFTMEDLGIQEKTQVIQLGNQTYEIRAENQIMAYYQAAREGNPFYLQAKEKVQASMPENWTQEQRDEVYNKGLELFKQRQDKDQVDLEKTKAELASLRWGQHEKIYEAVDNGSFAMMGVVTTDANGDFVVNKDNPVYQSIISVWPGSTPPTDAQIIGMYQESVTALKDKKDYRSATTSTAQSTATITAAKAAFAYDTESVNLKLLNGQVDLQTLEIEAGKVNNMLLMAKVANDLGPEALNDPEVKAIFAKYMTPEGYNDAVENITKFQQFLEDSRNNQLTIDGLKIDAAKIDNFNQMFSSPQAIESFAANKEMVTRIAKAVGADPDRTFALLNNMAGQNSTLRGLAVDMARFELTNGRQRLQFAANEDRRAEDANRRAWNDDKRQDSYLGLAVDSFNREGKWHDQEFQYREARDVVEDARSERELAYNAIAPLSSMINTAQEERAVLNQTFQETQGRMSEAQKRVYNKITWDDSVNPETGVTTYTPRLVGGTSEEQALFNTMNAPGGILQQLGEIKNDMAVQDYNVKYASQFLTNLVTTGEAKFGEGALSPYLPNGSPNMGANAPRYTGSATSGGGATVASGGARAFQGKTSQQAVSMVSGYIGNASTKEAGQVGSYVVGALNGAYGNVFDPRLCNTFVQHYLTRYTNITNVGGLGTGGAAELKNRLVKGGGTVFRGSGPNGSLTQADWDKLPSTAILVQTPPGPPYPNGWDTYGHSAIKMDDLVVQNSTYGASNGNYNVRGNVGFMDGAAFINGGRGFTYAVILPPSAYKQSGPNPHYRPPGGGSTGSRPAQASAGGPGVQSVGWINGRINNYSGKRNGSVQTVGSAAGNSGILTYHNSQTGTYYRLNDAGVRREVVGGVGRAVGQQVQKDIGISFQQLYKQDPARATELLRKNLRAAGFSGNLNGSIREWLKSIGVVK